MNLRSLGFASVALGLGLVGCPGPSPTPDASTDASLTDAPVPSDAPVVPPFPAECENINPHLCLAPWPSDRFRMEDTSTRTGARITIPAGAMPVNRGGRRVAPALFDGFDGFSPATSMMTVLDAPIDTSDLADESHIDRSLLAASPTVLLEVGEGDAARVAHFSEVDTWPDVDATRIPFYIRPAGRLRPRTRYLVAIRGLRRPDGTPLVANPYFRALRDGTPLAEATDIEARRAHFEDVFTRLAAAGIERSALLEAWDFTTGSDENLTDDLVRMRDTALRVHGEPGNCLIRVTSTEETPDANVFRRVHGTVRVPLFTRSADPGGETLESVDNARVVRNATGAVIQNPTTPFADVPFVASIPRSLADRVAAGGEPGRLLTYGHGLFGARSEVEAGWFRDTADELALFTVAVDWWGMSEGDLARVVRSLTDFSSFGATPERFEQGLVNFLVLTRSFRTPSCTIEASGANPFEITPTAGGAARRVWDPSAAYYYGNSQGGIMGATLAALSTDIRQFVLGVGGMSYSVMIPRSSNWRTYGALMRNGYSAQVDRALLMTMGQTNWDRSDPSTFAGRVLTNRLPCTLGASECPDGTTPEHQVLFMVGRDDAQVANITAEMMARTMGLPHITPSPRTPYGLTSVMAPSSAPIPSGYIVFDIPGTPVLGLGTRDPGGDNPAHEGVRRSPAAHRMMDAFFRPGGQIGNVCDGICDPT